MNQEYVYDNLQKRMKEEFSNQKPEFYSDINIILAKMIEENVKNNEIESFLRKVYSRSAIKPLPLTKLISFLNQEYSIVQQLQLK